LGAASARIFNRTAPSPGNIARFATNSPIWKPLWEYTKSPALRTASLHPRKFTITWPAKTASWAPRTESIDCSLIRQGFVVFRLNLFIGGISCCKSPRSRGDALRCRR
jgi:hypothetical protein